MQLSCVVLWCPHRLYTIAQLPKLKILDFRKVKLKVRVHADGVYVHVPCESPCHQYGKVLKAGSPSHGGIHRMALVTVATALASSPTPLINY